MLSCISAPLSASHMGKVPGKAFPILNVEKTPTRFSTRIVDALLEYQTLKIVNIGDKKIGLLHRIIQLIILAYIVGSV